MKGIIMINKKFFLIVALVFLVLFGLSFITLVGDASSSDYVWESWTDGTESNDTSGTYHIWNHSTEEGYQYEGHIEKDPFADRWIIYKGYGPDRKGYIKKDPFSGKHQIWEYSVKDGHEYKGEIKE
jgi:hypothetical protein